MVFRLFSLPFNFVWEVCACYTVMLDVCNVHSMHCMHCIHKTASIYICIPKWSKMVQKREIQTNAHRNLKWRKRQTNKWNSFENLLIKWFKNFVTVYLGFWKLENATSFLISSNLFQFWVRVRKAEREQKVFEFVYGVSHTCKMVYFIGGVGLGERRRKAASNKRICCNWLKWQWHRQWRRCVVCVVCVVCRVPHTLHVSHHPSRMCAQCPYESVYNIFCSLPIYIHYKSTILIKLMF